MNEKIDLTKILKDCPAGTKLYSVIYGDVKFSHISKDSRCPIILHTYKGGVTVVTKHGRHNIDYETEGECVLFPSKDQRDWSKFTAPWYKKEKFDTKTLKPFDKVLIRANSKTNWEPDFFGYIDGNWFMCVAAGSGQCVPYNEETKHLIGTKQEAPEYYRYWDD